MSRLLLADLRRHAGSWAWTVVVALMVGACVAGELQVLHGSLASAARAAGTTSQGAPVSADLTDAARTVFGFIVTGVVLAAASVLTATASLVIESRARDHGLWRALGMRPGTLRVLLLGQLALVGAVGSLGGVALGRPVASLMLPLLVDQQVALPGTTPDWQPLDALWTALVVAGAVLLGGWGPARRASRSPESALLAGRSGSMGWGAGRVLALLIRLAVAAGCATGLVAAVVALHRGTLSAEHTANAAVGGAFAALTLVCVLARWLVPALERLLALLPVPGPSWLVAARTAAVESRRSAATVLPFVVAIGLVAVMFGIRSAGVGNMRLSGFVSMFGLAFATAWTGGVAAIAMSASRRRRDAALLRAAGAQERDVLTAQVLEGVLHSLCAVVLGLVVSVATSMLLAAALERPTGVVVRQGPWAALGVVGAMTVVTTCLAVLLSARAGGGESVGEVLRGGD